MKRITPAKKIQGTVHLPGDKSISHRAALLGALSTEGVRVHNFSGGADCASTLACLEKLGASVSLPTSPGLNREGLQTPDSISSVGTTQPLFSIP